MFHIQDPQISGTIIQNLVSQATWHLEFVHPCYMWWRLADLPTVGIATTGLECHKVCSQTGLSPIFPAMLWWHWCWNSEYADKWQCAWPLLGAVWGLPCPTGVLSHNTMSLL